jgi:hypothetical protein
MKRRRKRIFRGVALAFAVTAFTASAAQARPLTKWGTNPTASPAAASYTAHQLRALELRSQGMNERYGSAATSLTPQQLQEQLRFQGVDKRDGLVGRTTTSAQSASLTPQQLSEQLRFQGVDKRHGLVGQTESSVQSSNAPVLGSSSDGISWSAAFAGAGAVLATAIVLLAGFTLIRRREHPVGV